MPRPVVDASISNRQQGNDSFKLREGQQPLFDQFYCDTVVLHPFSALGNDFSCDSDSALGKKWPYMARRRWRGS